MYSVSTQPLLQELSNTVANDAVKQVCFPDDNFAVRPVQGFTNGVVTYRPRDQPLDTAQNLRKSS